MSVSDDIVMGLACSWCGIYFENEHDYPVVCKSCFKQWQRKNRKGKKAFQRIEGLQVAHIAELGD